MESCLYLCVLATDSVHLLMFDLPESNETMVHLIARIPRYLGNHEDLSNSFGNLKFMSCILQALKLCHNCDVYPQLLSPLLRSLRTGTVELLSYQPFSIERSHTFQRFLRLCVKGLHQRAQFTTTLSAFRRVACLRCPRQGMVGFDTALSPGSPRAVRPNLQFFPQCL